MATLQIDIETYSSVDLIECGVYRYAESPDFEILLFAYAYDNEPVQVIDFTAFEDLPEKVLSDLTDPGVIKTAFNANFERTCIAQQFGIDCKPEQWRCTAVWASALGLPRKLEDVAKVLKLEAQKDTRGKNLIKYFSVPCKATKANGNRTRNYPHQDPEKWQQYIDYNRQDVTVEREIRRKLERFPVPQHEWALWALDQRINDQGVRIDPGLVCQAITCDEQYSARLMQEAQELTGINNPNSVSQIKVWLAEQGLDTPDGIGKEVMPDLLKQAPDEAVRRMLELRQEMGKTSVDKYNAMARSKCQDDRIRGVFQFCGASRTWRWAGRIFQPQNLPQNKVEDLTLAREILQSGDFDWLETLYGAPPFILSQLIRTALIPAEGHRFIVADFSAIEARVIAWLADEDWVLKVFRGHGRIYEATAAQMFKVPIETIVKGHANYSMRAKGKVAVLGLGYGMGSSKLKDNAERKHNLIFTDAEAQEIVRHWRKANSNIVDLWARANDAAMEAVRGRTMVALAHGVQYRYDAGMLFADLPSGHSLAYVKAQIKMDSKFNKEGITFKGIGQNKKWITDRTYGGRLVENLVQAIARDCLAESMMRLDQEGYKIVMHVHDEVVLEVPEGKGSVEHVCNIMSQPISWAPGLPLAVAGFECNFYQKD